MTVRTYDLILFGATGFAGRLTAEYLARHAPADCNWALAGRSLGKLEQVRSALSEIDPALADLPLLTADATDPASLRAIAESTKVVITTVGPYIHYGEPLVEACAEAGTDYVDLTGEPEFVDSMYLRHHARAIQTGARLIHSCGFDSIPHDLGAYFTVQQLPQDVALTVSGYVQASAAFSGGTFHSAITAFSRMRGSIALARQRRAVEQAEEPAQQRRAKVVVGKPHHDSASGGWAVPLPTIDPQIVVRSARALPRYGPDFHYSHFASIPHLWTVAVGVAGMGTLFGLAQIPPARAALLRRIKPGDGPSEAKRARSWFTVTFIGEGGGAKVITRVSGGDPGYDETAKMLAESALSLAFDELPATAGQVTTAAAMGDALIERLQKAGLTFEVIAS
ncbi:MAG: saccharopine dehydrogenase NADP-binding domain-containing protein [Jatrophihabitantaceae bacterium]